MKKFKINRADAKKYASAPKNNVIYECGYFVRSTIDGDFYIVDFPTLLSSRGDYGTIYPVYWTDEDEKELVAA